MFTDQKILTFSREEEIFQKLGYGEELCSDSARVFPKDHISNELATLPQHSVNHLTLAALILSLGPHPIQHWLLLQGLLPQKRWDDSGSSCQVTINDSGISAAAASIFSDYEKFENILEECIGFQLLAVERLIDGDTTYSVQHEARSNILSLLPAEELCMLGIAFVAYLFPRDEILEPSCVNNSRILVSTADTHSADSKSLANSCCPVSNAPGVTSENNIVFHLTVDSTIA